MKQDYKVHLPNKQTTTEVVKRVHQHSAKNPKFISTFISENPYTTCLVEIYFTTDVSNALVFTIGRNSCKNHFSYTTGNSHSTSLMNSPNTVEH